MQISFPVIFNFVLWDGSYLAHLQIEGQLWSSCVHSNAKPKAQAFWGRYSSHSFTCGWWIRITNDGQYNCQWPVRASTNERLCQTYGAWKLRNLTFFHACFWRDLLCKNASGTAGSRLKKWSKNKFQRPEWNIIQNLQWQKWTAARRRVFGQNSIGLVGKDPAILLAYILPIENSIKARICIRFWLILHVKNIFFQKTLKISAPNSFFQKMPKFFYLMFDFFNKFHLEMTIWRKKREDWSRR